MEDIIFPKLFLWGANSPPFSHSFFNPENDVTEFKKNISNKIDLINSLNVNSFRFALNWNDLINDSSRSIKKYNYFIDLLIQNNLEPIINIFDFDFFQIKFNDDNFLSFILDICKKMFYDFGNKIQFYSVLNNPMKFLKVTYLYNNISDFSTLSNLFERVIQFYEKVYNIIKLSNSLAKVSISEDLYFNLNETFSFNQGKTKIKSNEFYFSMFDSLINGKSPFFILEDNIHYDIDFIGLNFNEFVYFPSDEYAGLLTGFKTDSNKEYDKQSYTHFKDILERCSEDYDIPILITENSIGEDLNTLKINSLIDNIYQVNDSISKKNCKIFGYIYNSLTDFKVNNHSIKNGLYEINFKYNDYIPRNFAKIYSNIAKTNSITENYLKFIN
ncbi:MAG TPA: hypothetical protein GXX68_01455 [Defluviitoga tunisiensis]|jgi:beta-glucosidase/6-phospho-beta-glucosidase/beta-galactosidase|nr:hypothetical protein [Defluviitoga tunisiensis]